MLSTLFKMAFFLELYTSIRRCSVGRIERRRWAELEFESEFSPRGTTVGGLYKLLFNKNPVPRTPVSQHASRPHVHSEQTLSRVREVINDVRPG